MRPVADGLFIWPDERPALLGSRCRDCDTVTFPQQAGCPRCAGADLEQHLLPRVGTLWSWTVQRFEPKEPYRSGGDFTPYGVGYIDLAEVIVEARLTVGSPEHLQIGMPMELVLEPMWTESDGEEVVTYAFAPAAEVPV